MSAWRHKVLGKRALKHLGRALLVLPVMACAEVQVGIELAKRANRAVEANLAVAEPLSPQAQQNAAVSPYLKPAPEVFEATGIAQWDGKRTLQGVWVAHPLATTARRVRIFNTENNQAVDGALFKRDAALSGASVLISSEAAQRLGIEAGGSAELRIVAVAPIPRNQVAETPSAADVAEDQTDKPVASGVTQPETETKAEPEAEKPADAEIAVVAPKPRPTEAQKPAEPETPVAVVEPAAPAKPAVPEKPEPEQVTKAKPKQPAKPEPAETPAKPKVEPAKQAAAKPKDNNPSDTEGEFKWESAAAETAKPPEPAKKAKPAKPAAAKPKPKKAAASKLRQPFVQAGVFGVADNARRLINRLKKRGIPARGKTVTSNGRKLTRVLAGPFASIAQRNRAQAAIRKMGMPDAVPVRR